MSFTTQPTITRVKRTSRHHPDPLLCTPFTSASPRQRSAACRTLAKLSGMSSSPPSNCSSIYAAGKQRRVATAHQQLSLCERLGGIEHPKVQDRQPFGVQTTGSNPNQHRECTPRTPGTAACHCLPRVSRVMDRTNIYAGWPCRARVQAHLGCRRPAQPPHSLDLLVVVYRAPFSSSLRSTPCSDEVLSRCGSVAAKGRLP